MLEVALLLLHLQRAQRMYVCALLDRGQSAGVMQGLADAWVEIQIIREKLVDTRESAHRI